MERKDQSSTKRQKRYWGKKDEPSQTRKRRYEGKYGERQRKRKKKTERRFVTGHHQVVPKSYTEWARSERCFLFEEGL
jgi:hypothetical protein